MSYFLVNNKEIKELKTSKHLSYTKEDERYAKEIAAALKYADENNMTFSSFSSMKSRLVLNPRNVSSIMLFLFIFYWAKINNIFLYPQRIFLFF